MSRPAGAESAMAHMAGADRVTAGSGLTDGPRRLVLRTGTELSGAVGRPIPIARVESGRISGGGRLLTLELVTPVPNAVFLVRIQVAPQRFVFLTARSQCRSAEQHQRDTCGRSALANDAHAVCFDFAAGLVGLRELSTNCPVRPELVEGRNLVAFAS